MQADSQLPVSVKLINSQFDLECSVRPYQVYLVSKLYKASDFSFPYLRTIEWYNIVCENKLANLTLMFYKAVCEICPCKNYYHYTQQFRCLAKNR